MNHLFHKNELSKLILPACDMTNQPHNQCHDHVHVFTSRLRGYQASTLGETLETTPIDCSQPPYNNETHEWCPVIG